MERKLYPLDVGQMLQYLPIRETGTQRCCNISVFSGLPDSWMRSPVIELLPAPWL